MGAESQKPHCALNRFSQGAVMGIVTYALLCYGLTAVISFLLIGIILGINRAAHRAEQSRNPE
jgi:hypothetical protein